MNKAHINIPLQAVPFHGKSSLNTVEYFMTSYIDVTSVMKNLSRLTPYTDEIIGDHQCGFRRNISTTDQTFVLFRYCRRSGSMMTQYISYS
jgi:hypothetical protein